MPTTRAALDCKNLRRVLDMKTLTFLFRPSRSPGGRTLKKQAIVALVWKKSL
jgi:hypothetical protein